MFSDAVGPIRRPDNGEGLISESGLSDVSAAKTGGFPSLGGGGSVADSSSELLDWGDEGAVEKPSSDSVVRSGSHWKLSVDNKKADLTSLLSNAAYRFGLLVVVFVLVFRVGNIFGWLGVLPLKVQILTMGVMFLVTVLCGLSSLVLVLRKDVARRGEKFVKKVVKQGLMSMIFMNVLVFVLLFSVFVWPDLSSLVS